MYKRITLVVASLYSCFSSSTELIIFCFKVMFRSRVCNMSKKATIYVDGACSKNGGSNAQGGIGVYWPESPRNNISQPLSQGRQTNQRAEITAATRGINQARQMGYNEVTVKTDSHYVKNAAESWIPNWEREGWSRPIVNKQEFQELKQSMDQGIKVNFEYVPSQQNQADGLAKGGAGKS